MSEKYRGEIGQNQQSDKEQYSRRNFIKHAGAAIGAAFGISALARMGGKENSVEKTVKTESKQLELSAENLESELKDILGQMEILSSNFSDNLKRLNSLEVTDKDNLVDLEAKVSELVEARTFLEEDYGRAKVGFNRLVNEIPEQLKQAQNNKNFSENNLADLQNWENNSYWKNKTQAMSTMSNVEQKRLEYISKSKQIEAVLRKVINELKANTPKEKSNRVSNETLQA